jgi:hypothetical protein
VSVRGKERDLHLIHPPPKGWVVDEARGLPLRRAPFRQLLLRMRSRSADVVRAGVPYTVVMVSWIIVFAFERLILMV